MEYHCAKRVAFRFHFVVSVEAIGMADRLHRQHVCLGNVEITKSLIPSLMNRDGSLKDVESCRVKRTSNTSRVGIWKIESTKQETMN